MLFNSLFFLAGAGLAIAQSISSNCSSALLQVASSQEATCLDFALLAPLAVSNTSTTSIIPTVNSWLTGMCSQGACTNATLQAVITNITSGCSGELASLGLTTNSSTFVTTIQATYPTARQVVCLKDTSVNTLCTTEFLNDIQSATGTTLSLTNIVGLVTQAMSGADISVPQNVTCSNCSKAAYTVVNQNFPSLLSAEQATLQSECGSSFTDGQMPSSIQETAVNSTSSSAAVSLSVNGLNVGVVMLVAVSSGFALFA